MADGSSEALTLLTGPATKGADGGPTVRDIAGAEEIRKVRRQVAALPGRLHITRDTQAAPGQGTLSALELRLAQACVRFLKQRPDIGEGAGVSPSVFSQAADTDLALAQVARATGEMEAVSAVGEIILSARLTDRSDRVLLYAGGQGQGAQPTAEERDQLRVLLASVDLVYEKQLETARSRKARRQPRQAQQAEAMATKQEEQRRMLLREELRSGKLPE